jgi:ATP-dependent helicase HepA
VTYDRNLALVREDVTFLSQDHPMVQGALSFLLDRGEGEASVCLWPGSRMQGALFEFSFVLQGTGSPALELERYLPITRSELSFDHRGQGLAPELLRRRNSSKLQSLPEDALRGDLPRLRQMILPIVEKAHQKAEEEAQNLIRVALQSAKTKLEAEQIRLSTLAQLSGTVSKRELESHQRKSDAILECLTNTKPRLDAIRMTICQ